VTADRIGHVHHHHYRRLIGWSGSRFIITRPDTCVVIGKRVATVRSKWPDRCTTTTTTATHHTHRYRITSSDNCPVHFSISIGTLIGSRVADSWFFTPSRQLWPSPGLGKRGGRGHATG
jgi:hypothetical protein